MFLISVTAHKMHETSWISLYRPVCFYGFMRVCGYLCVVKSVGNAEEDVCIYGVGSHFPWFPAEKRRLCRTGGNSFVSQCIWCILWTWIGERSNPGFTFFWYYGWFQLGCLSVGLKNRPETLSVSEWVDRRYHLTVQAPWISTYMTKNRAKRSQDDTIMLFSLNPSHE